MKARRRPAFGRMRVDPQLVRDRFAEIVKHTPELRRADPRLLALYVVPPANEEG